MVLTERKLRLNRERDSRDFEASKVVSVWRRCLMFCHHLGWLSTLKQGVSEVGVGWGVLLIVLFIVCFSAF